MYRRMFLNEASLAGKLLHPHIVSIFDAVVDEEMSYIVMEYVEGGTLEKFCKPDNLLPVSEVAEIIFKCVRALAFANTEGLIHRDVKPGIPRRTRRRWPQGHGGARPTILRLPPDDRIEQSFRERLRVGVHGKEIVHGAGEALLRRRQFSAESIRSLLQQSSVCPARQVSASRCDCLEPRRWLKARATTVANT